MFVYDCAPNVELVESIPRDRVGHDQLTVVFAGPRDNHPIERWFDGSPSYDWDTAHWSFVRMSDWLLLAEISCCFCSCVLDQGGGRRRRRRRR